MRPILSIVLLSGCLAAAQAAAQSAPLPPAWKWRDAAGQVHVSDLPPPLGVPAKDILERPPLQRKAVATEAAAASAVAAAASAVPLPTRIDPELEARRRRAAAEQAQAARQQAEKDSVVRSENCGRAKAHLAALGDGQRIARTNAQGEREVLDDKGRAEEMQRARNVINSDCR